MEPALRFKEFDKKYELIRFGDIYDLKTTNSYSRDLLNYELGEVKNIHYGDIHTKFNSHFYLNKESVPYINVDIDLSKIKKESYCKEGDLIIADASEDYKDIGKCIEIIELENQKLVAGLHTILARLKSNSIAKGYISYAFQSQYVRHQIMTIAQGVKVLGLSGTRLVDVLIPLPTIEEQEKVASFLSILDKRKALLQRQKDCLDDYKRSLIQKLFNQEIRFKKIDGSQYPSWSNTTLGECTTLISRRNKDLLDLEIFSVTNTNGFVLQTTQFEGRRIAGEDLKSYKIINDGEFAYNPARINVGSIALFKKDAGIISSLYVCFKCKESLLNLFLHYFLQLDKTKHSICNVGEGGVRIYVWYPLFSKIEIQLPCLEEQSQIVNLLSTIDEKISNVQKQLELTKQYKQGLLQQMFV
jgi:type I restriction enzyme S subunit